MQRLLKVWTNKDPRVYKHLLKLCDDDEDIIFTNQFSQPMICIFADLIEPKTSLQDKDPKNHEYPEEAKVI